MEGTVRTTEGITALAEGTTARSEGPIDSREALLGQVRAGARVRYLHFWGHRPRPDGRLGPSCLSQWWPSPFTVDGVDYATAEHWMMAAKARLFQDAEAERRILAARHPAQAKKAGRLVRGFDEESWARERFGIVVEGSVRKFSADPGLRGFLLGTGERVLVEASPVDRVWGIGLAADDEAAADPERWRGPNLLGFALMAARDRLQGG
ncbi:NADAR family protein [Streptomyces sp. C6-003]